METSSFLQDLYGNIDNITLPMDRLFNSPPEVILIREHLRERTCKNYLLEDSEGESFPGSNRLSDAILVKTMANMVNCAGVREPEPHFTQLEKHSFDLCLSELQRRECTYLYSADHHNGFTCESTVNEERKCFNRHAYIGPTYIDNTLHRHQTPTKVLPDLTPTTPEQRANHLGLYVAQMPTPVKLFEDIAAAKRQKKSD